MKWEMEAEEIEPVLEKIWDLHDKLSDAIHSISRAQYLSSIKSLRKSNEVFLHLKRNSNLSGNGDGNVDSAVGEEKSRAGFVFVKDYPASGEEEDKDDYYSAVYEAKSLNGIRAALENLEDQLEFFHTIQVQQRAERDAAIARIEQSRIFLARRLSEHGGKRYKVIEEALAFVGDTGGYVSTNNLYTPASFPPGERSFTHSGNRFYLVDLIVHSFDFATKSLRISKMGGVLGNAALVALGMLALLHLHQTSTKEKCELGLPNRQEHAYFNKTSRSSRSGDSLSSSRLAHLDVTLARG